MKFKMKNQSSSKTTLVYTDAMLHLRLSCYKRTQLMFPQDIQAVNMTLKSNCTKNQGNNLVEAGENMSNQGGNKSSRVILVVGGYGLYDTGAAFRLYLLYRCCTRVLSSNPDLRTLKWGFLTFYRVSRRK